MTDNVTKIAIIEDQREIREGLCRLINSTPEVGSRRKGAPPWVNALNDLRRFL